MSAPDTNIEKQETRHKPALLGIKAAMIFGVLMVLIVVFLAVRGGDEPEETVTSENTVMPVSIDPAINGPIQTI